MRTLFLTATLISSVALAKPWNGIEPGVSKKAEVLERFGKPSKTVSNDGTEILAYLNKEAIRGTAQAQFKIDPKTQLVERIDVFPGPVIDKETIESTYGPQCPAGKPLPTTPCFTKKLTDDFRTYYVYARLGMAIFFNEDGKTVQSIIFQVLTKPAPSASAKE